MLFFRLQTRIALLLCESNDNLHNVILTTIWQEPLTELSKKRVPGQPKCSLPTNAKIFLLLRSFVMARHFSSAVYTTRLKSPESDGLVYWTSLSKVAAMHGGQTGYIPILTPVSTVIDPQKLVWSSIKAHSTAMLTCWTACFWYSYKTLRAFFHCIWNPWLFQVLRHAIQSLGV